MILRTLAAIAVTLALAHAALAQQFTPNSVEFDRFVADFWKDAQAAGITRATFAKAFNGVTFDPRVIATTKRQPEYNKPAGAYVNSIASAHNAATGLRKELEWRSDRKSVV